MPRHHLLHVRHGLVEQRVARGEDDDRHRAVDQRDGAVFQFARCIAFGVDVADFLQFQRPFQRQREHRAPAQEQHVLRLGHGGGDGGDLPLAGQRLIDEAGQRRKVIQMAPHLGLRQVAAIKPGFQRQQQKHRQLTGEGLGGGDANLDPRQERQRHIAFPRDGRRRDIHHPDDFLDLVLRIAKGGQGIGGFARLADEKCHGIRGQRRLAVAEFRGDIDLAVQPGKPFEPVLRGQAGVIGGAAGDHGQPVEAGKVDPVGQGDASRARVMLDRVAEDDGLFGDLLGHEMLVARLFDAGLVDADAGQLAVGAAAPGVEDLHPLAGDEGMIAFLKIGDAVGHRRQRARVGAHEHLTVAMPDGQRRPLAGGNHQVLLSVEEEKQREGTLQTGKRGARRVARGHALIHEAAGQKDDGFGIRLRLRRDPGLGQFGAQFAEILDDPVMDDRHRA